MSIEREISVLEISEKEVQEYQWDFKIPPKSRIQQNIKAIAAGGFCFSELKFKTGMLASLEHSWGFALYCNQVNAYLSLPRRNMHRKYTLYPSKLELYTDGLLKATHSLRFQHDLNNIQNPNVLWAASWINNDESWDDTVDMMRVTLFLECEHIGKCLISLQSELQNKKLDKGQKSSLELDASDLFLSEYLSDVVFVCGDDMFPAHRFLLTCKSTVFNCMFQHQMKEAKEGRIVIEDMEPKVLKELLRFMYCGTVDNLKVICDELFVAADKYNLETLKLQCEAILVASIKPKNALEMYILAETHGGEVLMAKAVEVLKRNKIDVVQDPETFREFSIRYPALMFELYKL